MPVRYSIIQGVLPDGLELSANGSITGTPPTPTKPSWITDSNSLSELTTGEMVSLTFTATSANQIAAYQTVSDATGAPGVLPPGLVLHAHSGELEGAVVIDPLEGDFTPEEAPLWETESGTLLDAAEFAIVETYLRATPRRGEELYFELLPDFGGLPFGLVLDSGDGRIGGVTPETDGVFEFDSTTVTWLTPSGVIGVVNEFMSIETTLFASSPKTLSFHLVDGFGSLPFGLTLDSGSGTISGTATEVTNPNEPVIRPANSPTWITPADLGNVTRSSTVSLPLNAAAAEGRTVTRYFVSDTSALPFGLTLDSVTGLIAGNAPAVSEPQTYRFTVHAEDNALASSRRDFVLHVI